MHCYNVNFYLPVPYFHLAHLLALLGKYWNGSSLLRSALPFFFFFFPTQYLNMVCYVQLKCIFSWEQADDQQFHKPRVTILFQQHPVKWKTETKHFNHMCIKYTGFIKYDLKLPVCFGDSLSYYYSKLTEL